MRGFKPIPPRQLIGHRSHPLLSYTETYGGPQAIYLVMYLLLSINKDINSPMQLQALIINFLRWNSPTGTRGLCKDLSKTGLNWVPHCVGVGFQYYLHLLAMEKNILACKMALGLSYIPII